LNAIAASDVGFSASAMDFAMNLKAPPRSSNCTPESFATYCNFDNSDADTPNFFDASSRSDPSWMADLARFASAPTDTNPARDRPMESTTDSMPFSPCTEDVIARVVWSLPRMTNSTMFAIYLPLPRLPVFFRPDTCPKMESSFAGSSIPSSTYVVSVTGRPFFKDASYLIPMAKMMLFSEKASRSRSSISVGSFPYRFAIASSVTWRG